MITTGSLGFVRRCKLLFGVGAQSCDRRAGHPLVDLGSEGFGIRPQLHPSLLRAAWWELCSAYWRMKMLRRTRLHRHGICLLTREESLAHTPLECRRLRSVRIQCIRKLLAIHPAATVVDLDLLSRAIVLDRRFLEVRHKEALSLNRTSRNACTVQDPRTARSLPEV